MLERPAAATSRQLIPGRSIIGDNGYFGRAFEAELTERELDASCGRVRKGEARRAEAEILFKPLRQVIGSPSTGTLSRGSLTWNATAARPPGAILARVLAPGLARPPRSGNNE